MNKKGFTLIELIAVVVIMSIIAIIATPNIINMIDKGKKDQYITNAKEFISKATYMYKQDKYRNDTTYFTTNDSGSQIKLGKIEGIKSEDLTDPYGFKYDINNSYIIFKEPSSSSPGVQERKVIIHLESNDDNSKCYVIDTDKDNLSVNSVKEGVFSNNICNPKQP